MRTLAIAMALAATVPLSAFAQTPQPRPIIDMHLHTGPWTRAPLDSLAITAYMRATLDSLNAYNVVYAIASGSYDVAVRWAAAAPGRILASAAYPCEGGMLPNGGPRCFTSGRSIPDTTWLRAEHRAGRLGGIGELMAQYLGMAPADPALEPTWALAESLDLPVGIHMGMGPPGAAYPGGVCGRDPCAPHYRMQLSDPMLLEPVLRRHPGLRVYVMHAGWPYLDHLIGLLYAHPRVYVDIAVWWAAMPKEEFQANLLRLVRAGYGDRIMYGSDLPEMGKAIAAIEETPGLSEKQKAAIFHDNAARFLRLPTSEE
jgi:uncharacterized protein